MMEGQGNVGRCLLPTASRSGSMSTNLLRKEALSRKVMKDVLALNDSVCT